MIVLYIIDPSFKDTPTRVTESDIPIEELIEEINNQGFIPWTVFINKPK